MNNYKIIENILVTNLFTHIFNLNIEKVLVHGNKYIVMTEIPIEVNDYNNIYALNNEGKLLWQIQSTDLVFGFVQSSPYVGLSIVNDHILSATNFSGLMFHVNLNTGELIEKFFVK